ncbi:MAG: hypothetical protein ABIO99_00065 [Candidatus Limnocylindria bacterium]
MRCRRICRELLWLARFGEFGPSSAPHLDHLSQCGGCRDEVGFDRALVQQLRRALAERIAAEEGPSPSAWATILERAVAPERGLWAFIDRHAAVFAIRLRTATAVTAMALAGIIATSTHVAITHPEAGSAETEVAPSAAGELFERQALVPRPRDTGADRVPVAYVPAVAQSDPEAAFLVSAASISPGNAASVASADLEQEQAESTIESFVVIGHALGRQSPADPAFDPGAPASGEPASTVPAGSAAGEPF